MMSELGAVAIKSADALVTQAHLPFVQRSKRALLHFSDFVE
jgi:hypothetical protein